MQFWYSGDISVKLRSAPACIQKMDALKHAFVEQFFGLDDRLAYGKYGKIDRLSGASSTSMLEVTPPGAIDFQSDVPNLNYGKMKVYEDTWRVPMKMGLAHRSRHVHTGFSLDWRDSEFGFDQEEDPDVPDSMWKNYFATLPSGHSIFKLVWNFSCSVSGSHYGVALVCFA